MSEHIAIDLSDRILTIEIRRPDKKNALTADMYAALGDALRRADVDPGVRVALIRGQPDCFTAGNDLKDFLNQPPRDESSPVFGFLSALATMSKPLVAAVNGVAVGIGTTMLLHCDLVYAGAGARFQLPFASLGLCPEAASSFLLPRLAGHQRAAELLLLGEPFGAEKAREIGLVNEVLPDDRVIDAARERALKLVALPAAALRVTKALMREALGGRVVDAMKREGAQFRQRLDSPEAKEAFGAFLEKRKPDFSRFDT